MGLIAVLGAIAACTGSDPVEGVNVDSGAGDGGGPTTEGGGGSETGTPDDSGVGVDSGPRNPSVGCVITTPTPCGGDPEYGPDVAIHFDACKMTAIPEGRVSTWSAVTGPFAGPYVGGSAGQTGGTLCKSELNARPAMRFKTDGFTTSAADASNALDNLGTGDWAIYAVMQYAAGTASAGSIVYQRNSETAPYFEGPQLIANFAFASEPGTTNLMSTTTLGAGLRFGVKPPGLGPYTAQESIAITTPTYVPNAFVVRAARSGTELRFSLNGEPDFVAAIEPTVEKGAGRPINIGRAGSANNFLDGAIGELLVYRVGRADEGLSAKLKMKWGIP